MMRFILLIAFLILDRFSSAQINCTHKTPTIEFVKPNTYRLISEFRPYKIIWKQNGSIFEVDSSTRLAPVLLHSDTHNFHYLPYPFIKRNGEVYYIADSCAHISLFRYISNPPQFQRVVRVSDYPIYPDSLYNTLSWLGSRYHSHRLLIDSNDNAYLNWVYAQYFCKINIHSKVFSILDSFQNSDWSAHYKIGFDSDFNIYRNIEPTWMNYGLYKYLSPDYLYRENTLEDTLHRNSNIWRFCFAKYKTKFYSTTWNKDNFVISTDTKKIDSFFNPFSYGKVEYPTASFIDGLGTIYATKFTYNTLESDNIIYMYNLYSKRMQSIVVNIDDYQMKLVLHSVQIDCSGNILVFGFKPIQGSGTRMYTPKLSLYKVPSYIDTTVFYSQPSGLSAQIVYYDNDTIDLVYAPPVIRIDTQVCNSYTYRNKTYAQSGTYYDTIFSTSYSDTICTLNITVYRDRYDTVRKTVCDSTNYFNSWYKQSGVYTQKYKSANSCDSFPLGS